jgi:hypothetical protein
MRVQLALLILGRVALAQPTSANMAATAVHSTFSMLEIVFTGASAFAEYCPSDN